MFPLKTHTVWEVQYPIEKKINDEEKNLIMHHKIILGHTKKLIFKFFLRVLLSGWAFFHKAILQKHI